jgi:hypothetical protein
LVDAKRIEAYEVRSERFIHVRNWEKHQRIDNAGKNRVPLQTDPEAVPVTSFREPPRTSASLGEPPLDTTTTTTTKRTTTTTMPTSRSAEVVRFDFETVYLGYPRKEGKADGMAAVNRTIRTEADFQLLAEAVQNYARVVAGRPPDKIKHWSSFIAKDRWREYVNGAPAVVALAQEQLPPRIANPRLADEDEQLAMIMGEIGRQREQA